MARNPCGYRDFPVWLPAGFPSESRAHSLASVLLPPARLVASNLGRLVDGVDEIYVCFDFRLHLPLFGKGSLSKAEKGIQFLLREKVKVSEGDDFFWVSYVLNKYL